MVSTPSNNTKTGRAHYSPAPSLNDKSGPIEDTREVILSGGMVMSTDKLTRSVFRAGVAMAILSLFTLATGSALSQANAGITATVTDSSGGVIGNANVTIPNQGTSVVIAPSPAVREPTPSPASGPAILRCARGSRLQKKCAERDQRRSEHDCNDQLVAYAGGDERIS